MHAQCRLRPFSGGQLFLLRFSVSIGKYRFGENHVMQTSAIKRQIGGIVPRLTRRIESHRHFGTHADILATLTREEEGQLTRICRTGRVVHTGRSGIGGTRRFFNRCGGLCQFFCQFTSIRGDDGQTGAVIGDKGKLCFAGNMAKFFLVSCQGTAFGDQFSRAGGTEQHQFGRNGTQAPGRFAGGNRGYILLKCYVEIAAAKAEAGNGSAARVGAIADPRAALGVQVKRALFDFQLGIRAINLDRWWQHLVMQGHDCLEQAGRTGRCLGVTDL